MDQMHKLPETTGDMHPDPGELLLSPKEQDQQIKGKENTAPVIRTARTGRLVRRKVQYDEFLI